MAEDEPRDTTVSKVGHERQSRLSKILEEHPEARPQLGEAVGGLLRVVVATLAIVGLLLIWHLKRRARMIRDRLSTVRDETFHEADEDDQARPKAAGGAG